MIRGDKSFRFCMLSRKQAEDFHARSFDPFHFSSSGVLSHPVDFRYNPAP